MFGGSRVRQAALEGETDNTRSPQRIPAQRYRPGPAETFVLRAGSGDCHHPGMSCGANRGSHPLRSINSSSSAADRARAQAHRDLSCPSRLIPALPSTAHRSCCGPSSPATCWKPQPCQAGQGAVQKSQFHLHRVHTTRLGYLGPSRARAGALAWQQATPRGWAGRRCLLSPQGRLWKRAVIPLNLHGHEAKSPQRRRCQNERKVKKKKKKSEK